VGLFLGEYLIPQQPLWLFCLVFGAVTSRLDPPNYVKSMVSRHFVMPWLCESQWTPCPHVPPTSLHISLLALPKWSPSIFSSSHTFIHSTVSFLSHPNAPVHIVYQPYPPTPHFRFFGPILAIPLLPAPSPTNLHPLQLFLKALYYLLSPFHSPAPVCPPAPIFAFLGHLWTLFACISFSFQSHMYIHDYWHWIERIWLLVWGVTSC
jgi:hypothetical protein